MTKMKSKKMTKSTFAIIIMAIAMVAMLAFGGTYAYFTAESFTKGIEGSATLGTIALDESATKFEYTKMVENVLPGETLFTDEDGDPANATLTIVDNSNRASYIFIEVSYSIVKSNDEQVTEEGLPTLSLTGATGTLTDNTDVYYILTTEVAEDGEAGAEYELTGINIEIPTAWDNSFEGAEITLSFTIKSIQAAGFDSADDAYAQYQENGGEVEVNP